MIPPLKPMQDQSMLHETHCQTSSRHTMFHLNIHLDQQPISTRTLSETKAYFTRKCVGTCLKRRGSALLPRRTRLTVGVHDEASLSGVNEACNGEPRPLGFARWVNFAQLPHRLWVLRPGHCAKTAARASFLPQSGTL